MYSFFPALSVSYQFMPWTRSATPELKNSNKTTKCQIWKSKEKANVCVVKEKNTAK